MRVHTLELTDRELEDLYVAMRAQIAAELRLRANDRHPVVRRLERLRIKIGQAQA